MKHLRTLNLALCLSMLGFSLFGLVAEAKRDVWVNGYTRSNGTHVQGHYRTAPDNSVWNNYSTRGNYNPYTGDRGTANPYQHPNNTNIFGNTNSDFSSDDNTFGY